jgi:multidrug transporter EmrE-like cation transporter
VIGIRWLREPLTALKIVGIGLIIAGVFGLNAGVRDG